MKVTLKTFTVAMGNNVSGYTGHSPAFDGLKHGSLRVWRRDFCSRPSSMFVVSFDRDMPQVAGQTRYIEEVAVCPKPRGRNSDGYFIPEEEELDQEWEVNLPVLEKFFGELQLVDGVFRRV